MNNRRGGIVSFKIDGILYSAKGNFTYNLGQNKRETMIGSDGIHGYKETPQAPFIEGEITDSADLNLKTLVNLSDSTITLETGVGKVIALRNAWFAGEGSAE